MTLDNVKNATKVIRELIREELRKSKPLGVFVVTAIDFEDTQTGFISEYKCSIKHINFPIQYDNVPIAGLGLGNLKGVMKYPSVGDLVLAGFLDEGASPIILGTLFDQFTQSPDTAPLIRLNELFLNNQQAGAYLYLNQDNTIVIKTGNSGTEVFPSIKLDGKTKDITITTDGGAVVKVNSDGSVDVTGTSVNLNGSGPAVARVGDAISVTVTTGSSAGTYIGTITSGSSSVNAGG